MERVPVRHFLGRTRWDALFTLEKSHHKLWKLKENLARMEAKFIRICLSLPHPKFDEGWHLVLEKKSFSTTQEKTKVIACGFLFFFELSDCVRLREE